jgi:hypothetical protein
LVSLILGFHKLVSFVHNDEMQVLGSPE